MRLLPRARVGGHGALIEIEAVGVVGLVHFVPFRTHASGFPRAVLVAAKLAVLLIAFLQLADFAGFAAVVLHLGSVFWIFAEELVAGAVVVGVVFAAEVAAF